VKVVVAAVGKPRNRALAEVILDYETRAARYWPLQVSEVRAESAAGRAVADVQRREADRLLAATVGCDTIVACDARGQSRTSEQFCVWLQRQREMARSVAFLIGGAFGLGSSVRTPGTMQLSLSPWTLPHDLARLVLAEQLYRAGTIVRGEPYHK
jgi:23S rRNA (pseudouridine1915-N3)-methyltransferase